MSLFLYAIANILYAQAIPTNLLVVAGSIYFAVVLWRIFL